MKKFFLFIVVFCMCVLSSCTHSHSQSSIVTKKVEARGYNRKCQVFRAIPPSKDGTKEILFIGHSLVNEFLVDVFMPHGDDVAYVNMGIGGDDTRGMYARRELAFARNPYKMIVEIGVNDLTNEEETDTIMYYLSQFILDAVSHDINLVVCGIIPSRDTFSERTRELNAKIQQLAEDFNCTFVDLSSMGDAEGKLLSEYDCGDHIHLSGEGYIYIGVTC